MMDDFSQHLTMPAEDGRRSTVSGVWIV